MNGPDTRIPTVDWTARQISDPLLRLRFLKAAAPVWQPERAGKRLRWRLIGIAFAALVLLTAAERFIDGRSVKASVDRPASATGALAVSAPILLPPSLPPRPQPTASVWPVEKTAEFEIYSNGLRIENRFATQNHPRSYIAFPLDRGGSGQSRSSPAGIVFHTTESLQAPFEPEENRELTKVGEALLGYVKKKKAYNFVIDRFGRVFRVVREEDAADHAGYSVWSDERTAYLNLNESFIGVAVETRTAPGQSAASVTPAQIRAIGILTEMLRARFHISGKNCVTHAQVSVNPTRMLAGYHMDWASSFPFEAVGLPDNYDRPLPAVALFGFQCDATFTRAAGSRLSEAAARGERELEMGAAAAGSSVSAYRKALEKRYRERLAATRSASASQAEGGYAR